MKTIDKLQSTGAVYRLNGIVECLDKKSLLDDEIDGLKQLKKDSTILAGRKISSYACAVLDLLEIEAYTGKDVDTKNLIEELR